MNNLNRDIFSDKDNKPKSKCRECNKSNFSSRDDARSAASALGKGWDFYECPWFDNVWHLTSTKTDYRNWVDKALYPKK